MQMIQLLMWLLEKYKHLSFVVCTNSLGERVYADEYQIAVKIPGLLQIEKLQEFCEI